MSKGAVDRAVEAAAGLRLDQVRDRIISHAGHVVADTIGVVRGGSRSREITRLIELDVEEGLVVPRARAVDDRTDAPPGTRSSTVLSARTPRSSAAHAAFLNATAGTFLELDEGMRPTGHPGMHVVPAAVAVAERAHSSGDDLLQAILAGYETTARLFLGFRLRYPVHPHGHFGSIGAAVAVALLEGEDPVAAARIASTTPLLPVWDACFEGATARNSYTGLAAQAGVRATALVRAGFTGSERALDVTYGTIAGDLVDEDVLGAALDYERLGVTRNYFKLHSACALSHAAIDAVNEMDLESVADIRHVLVETVSNNMKLDRQPRPNDLSGRFSLQYAVATAILLRRTDPEAFHFRQEVAQFAQRVEIVVAPDLEAKWPDSSPARVTIDWSTQSDSNTVDNPRGHHTRPIGERELHEKFTHLVGSTEESDLWWPRLNGLRDVPDCAMLFAGMH